MNEKDKNKPLVNKNQLIEIANSPQFGIPASATPMEIIEWVMVKAKSLLDEANPAAKAYACKLVLEALKVRLSIEPPQKVEVKPRPRVAIVIEDEEEGNNE